MSHLSRQLPATHQRGREGSLRRTKRENDPFKEDKKRERPLTVGSQKRGVILQQNQKQPAFTFEMTPVF
ncbi:hypothetical protein [Xanthocytophaga agilis]|uniref:Uncharacterized protein n=1 Tax=Xanthocytophaga agilis TaxID=3048010 RepID=A0AAE3UJR8_9BACT|nr:hypothetical protein [Xanthocytophaga agilis]MDJ1505608.1 hypothetical protein [Xanthocytophaga agilis]